METKKTSFWFLFKMLLLMNVVLITAIVLAYPRPKTSKAKEDCFNASKKINVDVLNSITVKLM
jgi:hypothetical protein